MKSLAAAIVLAGANTFCLFVGILWNSMYSIFDRLIDDGDDLLVLVGKWADPGGTAMPGQPATRPEQAPEPHPLAKISLISKGAHGPRIRY